MTKSLFDNYKVIFLDLCYIIINNLRRKRTSQRKLSKFSNCNLKTISTINCTNNIKELTSQVDSVGFCRVNKASINTIRICTTCLTRVVAVVGVTT